MNTRNYVLIKKLLMNKLEKNTKILRRDQTQVKIQIKKVIPKPHKILLRTKLILHKTNKASLLIQHRRSK